MGIMKIVFTSLQTLQGSRTALRAMGFWALSGAAVWASPLQGPDPMQRLLIEKGLLNDHSLGASTPLEAPSLNEHERTGAAEMIMASMNFLDVPYQLGGTHESTGFDCSGFTKYIFEKSMGIILPRRADEQARAPGFMPILHDDLKPGDLVFFNTLARVFSHVGIYIGDGKFIHAPRTGTVVRIENMRSSYWSQRFNGARRVMASHPPTLDGQPERRANTLVAPRWLRDIDEIR